MLGRAAGRGYPERVPPPSFQRARSALRKQQRATDLLEAARALACEQSLRTLTLTAIAARAGVHVSGVRRYFASREDILLTLAGQEWRVWGAEVTAAVLGAQAPISAHDLGRILASAFVQHPLFCDLMGHVPLSLEPGAAPDCVRTYELIRAGALGEVADAVAAQVPSLDRPRAAELLATAVVLAGPLWHQTTQPTSTPKAGDAAGDGLAGGVEDGFTERLSRVLDALVRGLSTPSAI